MKENKVALIEIGKSAPDFRLKDQAGKEHTLKDDTKMVPKMTAKGRSLCFKIVDFLHCDNIGPAPFLKTVASKKKSSTMLGLNTGRYNIGPVGPML